MNGGCLKKQQKIENEREIGNEREIDPIHFVLS